jgi:hypothetical protein
VFVAGVTTFKFAWAVRDKLPHPPILPKFVGFIRWCWDHGEQSGHCKISPHSVRVLAEMHGTIEGANKYPEELYWQIDPDAARATTFDCYDIPETWRIKQSYGQIGSG